MNKTRQEKRNRRRLHIRKTLSGTGLVPRVSVFKSNKYIFVQLCDDIEGTCRLGFSEKKLELKKDEKPLDRATRLGAEYAKLIQKEGIEKVVFDRGGYKYHGRIKALADSMREAGINF